MFYFQQMIVYTFLFFKIKIVAIYFIKNIQNYFLLITLHQRKQKTSYINKITKQTNIYVKIN